MVVLEYLGAGAGVVGGLVGSERGDFRGCRGTDERVQRELERGD